ncbi:hypothetical protein [Streptococcus sp.]|nr:hypothetical protein [Streptococcus sp.]DAH59072.1 MAG TPA: Membrane-associated protein [Caudoviricetes sp.]MDU6119559.1 hypothetical protein [Streptococcus sp.]MDU6444782.1 hypothetical protein [Streptococcus sp.]MDU6638391.1 hypothetical protein [Streptococcus sp.]MDU7208343.1 hypothetical protein [Streptococcus sp.]
MNIVFTLLTIIGLIIAVVVFLFVAFLIWALFIFGVGVLKGIQNALKE